MKTILVAIVISLLLSGCSLFQTKEPEVRTVYKFIRVPSEMSEKVSINPPPEPVYYSKLPWDKQEELLMSLVQDRMQQIGVCNARLQAIDTWSGKQLKIYEPANP